MVALIVSATMLLSCQKKVPRIDDITNKDELPSQEVKLLEVHSSSRGKIRHIIKTPYVRSFKGEEPYDEFPNGGLVEAYNDSLQLETTIFSKYAIHKMKPEELWIATDSVVVHNLLTGQSLYTDTLYWDMEKKEIYTHSYVEIVTPDIIMPSENGMRSDEHFRDYEFFTIRNSEYFYNDSMLKRNSDTTPNQPTIQSQTAIQPTRIQ